MSDADKDSRDISDQVSDKANDKSPQVTVVISRRVKKGNELRFEELSSKMTESAIDFPGYLGAALFRPSTSEDPEYRVIFKFNTQKNLDYWLQSNERSQWLQNIEDLLEQPSAVEVMSGLVTWFTLPGKNPVQPPAKYKMAIVSWLALFPTVTLIFGLFGDYLAMMPLIPRVFIVTVTIMLLMTYILMPRFTQWFKFWLFPKDKRNMR